MLSVREFIRIRRVFVDLFVITVLRSHLSSHVFRIVLGSFETGVRWSNGIGPAYRQRDALKFDRNPVSSSNVAVTMLAHEADGDRILKLSGALWIDLQHSQRRMQHGPSRTTSEEVLCDPAFEVERAPDIIGLILTQEDVHHHSRAGIPLATFYLYMRVGMSKNANAKQQVRRLKKDKHVRKHNSRTIPKRDMVPLLSDAVTGAWSVDAPKSAQNMQLCNLKLDGKTAVGSWCRRIAWDL